MFTRHGTNFRGNVFTAGWRNHACFMAVQIASRGLSDGTILAFVPFFFVRLSNSFEQVLVPGVTENRYGANNKQRGWRCEGRNLVLYNILNIRMGISLCVTRY